MVARGSHYCSIQSLRDEIVIIGRLPLLLSLQIGCDGIVRDKRELGRQLFAAVNQIDSSN